MKKPDISKQVLDLYAVILLLAIGWRWWYDHRPTPHPTPSPAQMAWAEIGKEAPDLRCNATWYSWPEHGRPTASGELFDSTGLTCAIYKGFLRHAPYGSTLLVRNAVNGRMVLVRVNDNMPSRHAKVGKMLDLSRAAAESLGMIEAGVVPVEAWKLNATRPNGR